MNIFVPQSIQTQIELEEIGIKKKVRIKDLLTIDFHKDIAFEMIDKWEIGDDYMENFIVDNYINKHHLKI